VVQFGEESFTGGWAGQGEVVLATGDAYEGHVRTEVRRPAGDVLDVQDGVGVVGGLGPDPLFVGGVGCGDEDGILVCSPARTRRWAFRIARSQPRRTGKLTTGLRARS